LSETNLPKMVRGVGFEPTTAWRDHPQIPSFSILNILRFAFSVSSN